MDVLKFKSNKTGAGSCVILVLSMLILLAATASAFAQDDNAVAMLRQIGRTFAEIAEKASPAIVVLTVDKPIPRGQRGNEQWWNIGSRQTVPLPEPRSNSQPTRPDLPSTRPGSPRMQKLVQKAQGLGFIVSEDGHILTCNNIVDNVQKVEAMLADGRKFEAEVVGTDPDTNIAVLKIDANDLPVLRLGDSDALGAGDWVVGIGNAMGLGRTFAAGLVTAKNRSGLGMAALEDFVQTNINLQIGDGGGPLLDLDGNVVGINFAIMGAGSGTGISFAIPANMVKGIYEQLIEKGTVERAFLGVALKDVDAEIAKALGLKTIEGVVIANVVKDSAAEKAGIRQYDVLVEFDGKAVESAGRFIVRVAELKPGTQIDVVVLRDGQRRNLNVTLGERPKVQTLKPDDIPNAP
jgi:serine protease Do